MNDHGKLAQLKMTDVQGKQNIREYDALIEGLRGQEAFDTCENRRICIKKRSALQNIHVY